MGTINIRAHKDNMQGGAPYVCDETRAPAASTSTHSRRSGAVWQEQAKKTHPGATRPTRLLACYNTADAVTTWGHTTGREYPWTHTAPSHLDGEQDDVAAGHRVALKAQVAEYHGYHCLHKQQQPQRQGRNI